MNKFLSHIILLADSRPTIIEKLCYFVSVVGKLGVVAYLCDGIGLWFANNHQFSAFVILCLVINMGVGLWYHNKMNSFRWEEFFIKNAQMWVILIVVYTLLEMLRLTAGNNMVGEGFKVFIQVTTLLYPISKALKNLYILSQKQFPPAFIMERIYNFEKNGKIADLFDVDKKEE